MLGILLVGEQVNISMAEWIDMYTDGEVGRIGMWVL